MIIVNESKYPWLASVATVTDSNDMGGSYCWSEAGRSALAGARIELERHGAVAFPEFLTPSSVDRAVREMLEREDAAFTTNTQHNAYLTEPDTSAFSETSIYNHETKTIVASTAYDELPEDSVLKQLYHDPRLLRMVSSIVGAGNDDENDENINKNINDNDNNNEKQRLYLSEDPLGCCSVNVFRPGYFHGFHYDESEFSVTLMLQEAEEGGLFQYTDPIRRRRGDGSGDNLTLELDRTADVFRDHEFDDYDYDDNGGSSLENTAVVFAEHETTAVTSTSTDAEDVPLHTLEFRPGTLLVLAGSRSLHRVTRVGGSRSRFVAVLTFCSRPGFCNTPRVQEMFWGRSLGVGTRTRAGASAPQPNGDAEEGMGPTSGASHLA